MQSRVRLLLVCTAGVLLFTLIYMAVQIRGGGYKDLVLVAASGAAGVSVDQIEEISEKKILTTYEINQRKTVKTPAALHHVELKYVNYAYSSVMRYPILAGGFFTKDLQDNKSKATVLNEWAAFSMFGGTDIIGSDLVIDNLPFRVVGVIDDGDEENENIYLPVTLTNQHPDAFMVMMAPEKGIAEEYVVNVYKQIGITEDRYDFISLDKMSREIQERAVVGCLMAGCLLSLAAARLFWRQFVRKARRAKGLSKQYYWRTLVHREMLFLSNMVFSGGLAAVCAAAAFRAAAGIFEICLRWNAFEWTQVFRTDCFAVKVSTIQTLSTYSYVCLFSLVILLVLSVILNRRIAE